MDPKDTNTLKYQSKKKTTLAQELQLLMGKVPPQAIDLEEAVLGALLIDKEALSKISDFLRPDAFYLEKHARIYKAILSLFGKSEPIDIRTVTNELRFSGDLELVGGAFYVTELTMKVVSSANIEYHARLLMQYAIKRTLISVAAEIQRQAYDDTIDVFQVLDHAQQQLFEVTEQTQKRSVIPMNQVMRAALLEIEEKRKMKDGLTGCPSGFIKLDMLTAGWQKSDLIIVAARPAMGKTAFVLSTVRNAAVDHGKSCAIFSLEMSAVQLMLRLISSEAEIESEKIKKGTMQEHEWIQLTQKVSKLSKSKIFIDDTPGISILELRSKCRKLKSQHGLDLVVIDYLQLMSGENLAKGTTGNREQEIAYISRSLKSLAKELEIPVIALSQLSRAVETRGTSKRPQLSDLRESGSIEQDADMVIFLYRPEYYGLTEDEEGKPTNGVGEIIVAKHRNGPVDTVKLRYISKFTKFTNLDESDDAFPDSFSNNAFPPVYGSGSLPTDSIRLPSKNWDKDEGINLGKADDYPDAPF